MDGGGGVVVMAACVYMRVSVRSKRAPRENDPALNSLFESKRMQLANSSIENDVK